MTTEELECSDIGRWGPCLKRTCLWFLLLFACAAIEAGGAYVAYRAMWGI
jgi:hypothetical protein